MEQGQSLQQTVLEQLDTCMQKHESRHRPYPLHQNEFRENHRPKFKMPTCKTPRK